MAIDPVIDKVRRYLLVLRKNGFRLDRGVLFGSYARGEAHIDSDIDLLLPSEDFETLSWKQEDLVWSLTAQVDSRIEPVLCGERQWWTDEVSPLIDIARQEGIVIEADSTTTRLAREDFIQTGDP
jgi:uncharacterized protein